MKLFKALAVAGLLAAAPSAVLAAPAKIADEVASFVQPNPAARLTALRALLDAHGLKYEVQPFNSGKAGVGEGYNVVLTIGDGERDVLLTAHYDAKRLKDGSYVDGVVDNAASVVALVHAAHELKGGLKNHRLRIVFFDQEEYGLLGAHAYAATPQGQRVHWVINFDINAYGDTPFFSAEPNDAQPALLMTMLKACGAAGENCLGFEKYPPSDHLAFRKIGARATSISYLPRGEALALETLMADGEPGEAGPPKILGLIHTPADKIPEVDPATIARASKLAVAAARAFDAAD